MNVIDIVIDQSIILPDTCDTMPEYLRQNLLATLTHAMRKYECKYEDLRWSVKFDKQSGLPYITVKKR